MSADPNRVVKLYSRVWGIHVAYANATIIRPEQAQEYNSCVQQLGAELGDDLSMHEISKSHFNDKGGFYLPEPFRASIEGLLAYLRTKVPPEAIERIGYPTHPS